MGSLFFKGYTETLGSKVFTQGLSALLRVQAFARWKVFYAGGSNT